MTAINDTIICYDISHPRRLGRLFRYLKKHAIPMQHSVFLFTGDQRQLDRCLEQAARLIEPKEDDLRAYPLPARGLKVRLGRPVLPPGILWSGLPSPW
ncbi:MAG: CRISPR-associated endonuclease Cas2 [Azonexus sp.]|jgi:CRISPR-associated endonuclease Cas2|uniref:CRISPR-associated endonuclease Cas2 n=1 Tax=Azonexus sp. TaxID=1872668 RepID=UPI002823FD0E|nr:CRISPR-associated endonuclease Cas2 [Azonexus sp.]MDR0776274.1 CRISPR-associated endonuclease Cas2 [Azonexus sp.]